MTYDGVELNFTIRGQQIDYVSGVNLLSLMKLGRLVWPPPAHWVRSGANEIRRCKGHRDPIPHNMLWTPAGLRLIDGNDRKGEAVGRSAEAVLKRSVRAWWKNMMASPSAYVPRRSPLERKIAKMEKADSQKDQGLRGNDPAGTTRPETQADLPLSRER